MKSPLHPALPLALALAIATPQAAQAQASQTQQYAMLDSMSRTVATMAVGLALYDQINRIAVAQGRMSAAAADAQLRQRAEADHARALSKADILALHGPHRQAVQTWAASIAQATRQAQWPQGGAEAWAPMAESNLRAAQQSYDAVMAIAMDPVDALETYAKVAAWTRGQSLLTDTNNPFAGQRQRIVSAMPTDMSRKMMSGAMGLLVPPGVKLPPARALPTRPAPLPAVAATPVPQPTAAPAPTPAPTPSPQPSTADSGRRPPPVRMDTAPPRDLSGLEFDRNRPGADYAHFDLPVADPQVCRQACLADAANCRAFTYVAPGRQYAAPHCWLKSAAPAPVVHDCCVSGLGMEQTAPSAAPAQPPLANLPPAALPRLALGYAWTGFDADVVGGGTHTMPDGLADGHWRATVQLDSAQAVAYVAILSTDALGNIVPPHRWDSRDSRCWILAVYANGQRLNPSHMPQLGVWQGTVYLDLFGANPGGWLGQPGHTLLVIGLANGLEYYARAAHPGLR